MIDFTPPPKTHGAYLFDCDGTLADTMPIHYQAWVEAVKAQGVDIDYSPELFYSMAGMTAQDTVRALNQKFGISLDHEAVGQAKNALYAQRLPIIRPITEVVAFCQSCLDAGAPVAVVSGSSRTEVTKTLEAIELADKIETLVCQGETSRGKPHPEPFTHAADLLKVDYRDCLVLEDSIPCIEGVQSIGMSSILIPNQMLK
ncbi:MAG: HAD family phosphatase [Verrucomicrobiota bacterium]